MLNQKTQQFIDWLSIPHYRKPISFFSSISPEIDFCDPEIDSLVIFPLLEANLNGNTFYLAGSEQFFKWLTELAFEKKIPAKRVFDLLLSQDAEGTVLITKWCLTEIFCVLYELAVHEMLESSKIFELFKNLLTSKHFNQIVRGDGDWRPSSGLRPYADARAIRLLQIAALDRNMGYSAVIKLLNEQRNGTGETVANSLYLGHPANFVNFQRVWTSSFCYYNFNQLALVLNIMKQTNFEALSDFSFTLRIWDWGPRIVKEALETLGGTDIQLYYLESALDSKSEFHRFLGLGSTRKRCILFIVYLNEMRDDLLRSLKGMQTFINILMEEFETFLLESSRKNMQATPEFEARLKIKQNRIIKLIEKISKMEERLSYYLEANDSQSRLGKIFFYDYKYKIEILQQIQQNFLKFLSESKRLPNIIETLNKGTKLSKEFKTKVLIHLSTIEFENTDTSIAPEDDKKIFELQVLIKNIRFFDSLQWGTLLRHRQELKVEQEFKKRCIRILALKGLSPELKKNHLLYLLNDLKSAKADVVFLLESQINQAFQTYNSAYEPRSKSALLDPPKLLLDDDLSPANEPHVGLQLQIISNQKHSTDLAEIASQKSAEYPFIYAMMGTVQTSADTTTVPTEKSDLRLAVAMKDTEKPKETFSMTVEEAEKVQPNVVNPVEIPAEKAPPLRQSFFRKTMLKADNLGLPSVPQHVLSIPEPTLKTKVPIPN